MYQPRVVKPRDPNRFAGLIERVLLALLSLVVVCAIYRYCWIDVPDPYKCSALLNRGRWLDPGRRWRDPNPFRNWQPPGCIMHEYKKKDIKECFHSRRLVFIGDSTTRQIYWSVAKKMDQGRAEDEMTELLDLTKKHKDLEFTSDGITVQFIWDPWLNSTGLELELRKFKAAPANKKEADESAGLILLGAPGLWYARHGGENFQKGFKESIDHVIPFMDYANNHGGALPISRTFSFRKQTPNVLLLAPVQAPRYQALSPSREETITPQKIDQMNDYLQQVSAHSSADVIWSYSLMTWTGRSEFEESGLHVIENIALRKADVLLNLRCNADSTSNGYPFNRTCCSNYTKPNLAQILIIFSGMVALPAVLYMRRHHLFRIGRFLPAPGTIRAMSEFALVVSFCFYADRTQVFEKAQKQFKTKQFVSGCVAVGIAGLATLQRNTAPIKSTKYQGQSFLSREQTDEWKGWMQAFILIYHYTHGSQTLWIYEIVRLLVASYLFMTGFGHTLYFLRTDDYSLERVSSVLIRLNLLSCILPYVMRTDYLFYYFAPLISFWYIIIYTTLKLGRTRNSSFNFLLAKIVLSALLTTAFTMIPGILETVAFILRYTCAITWNITEWRFRTFLDMYIVYIGMIIAILFQRYSTTPAQSQPIDVLIRLKKNYSEIFSFVTFFASLFLLPGFWALTRRSPNKEDYNWWQPYISFIPILSFVVLRNSHSILRKYHLKGFAWLGRCSLETYVLQYHIWLAGDTSGLLRIGIWNRWTEAALLTPLFLWISWCTADATQKLTAWIVNGSSPASDTRGKSEDDEKESPYLLPTPSKDLRFDLGKGRSARRLGKVVVTITQSLRRRLLLITFIMWLGNITYR